MPQIRLSYKRDQLAASRLDVYVQGVENAFFARIFSILTPLPRQPWTAMVVQKMTSK